MSLPFTADELYLPHGNNCSDEVDWGSDNMAMEDFVVSAYQDSGCIIMENYENRLLLDDTESQYDDSSIELTSPSIAFPRFARRQPHSSASLTQCTENPPPPVVTKPRKPVSAFNLFFQENCAAIIDSHRESLDFSRLGEIARAKWENASSVQRKDFEQKARRDRGRYRRELKNYRDARRAIRQEVRAVATDNSLPGDDMPRLLPPVPRVVSTATPSPPGSLDGDDAASSLSMGEKATNRETDDDTTSKAVAGAAPPPQFFPPMIMEPSLLTGASSPWGFQGLPYLPYASLFTSPQNATGIPPPHVVLSHQVEHLPPTNKQQQRNGPQNKPVLLTKYGRPRQYKLEYKYIRMTSSEAEEYLRKAKFQHSGLVSQREAIEQGWPLPDEQNTKTTAAGSLEATDTGKEKEAQSDESVTVHKQRGDQKPVPTKSSSEL